MMPNAGFELMELNSLVSSILFDDHLLIFTWSLLRKSYQFETALIQINMFGIDQLIQLDSF